VARARLVAGDAHGQPGRGAATLVGLGLPTWALYRRDVAELLSVALAGPRVLTLVVPRLWRTLRTDPMPATVLHAWATTRRKPATSYTVRHLAAQPARRGVATHDDTGAVHSLAMPEAGLAGEAVTLGAGPGGSVLSSSRTCALLLVLSSGLLLVEDDVRALGAGLLGRIGLLARDALLDRGLVKRLLVLHLDSGLAALGGRLLTDLPLTGGRGGARGVGSSESLREDTSVLAGRRPCCAEPDARRAHTGCACVGLDRQDGGQEGRGPNLCRNRRRYCLRYRSFRAR